MKIGLLSLPLNWNYGGMLQQYALKEILSDLGGDVVVFSRRMDRIGIYRRAPVFFKWKMLSLLAYLPFLRSFPLIGVQEFKRRNLPSLTRDIFDDKTLRSLSNQMSIEAFVVGSDQVWNREAAPKLTNYFLDFTRGMSNLRRIAYAASFGKDGWNYLSGETEACSQLARHFDAISVREDSGVGLCREHFGVDAVHLLDPTLLLDRGDYQKIIERSRVRRYQNSLLTYILDESDYKHELIQGVSEHMGLEVVSLMPRGKLESLKRGLRGQYATVEQWLCGFYSADYVVTDSFHGTLFSVIFNKPFIAIANEERGVARFQSFLEMIGLEDRLVFVGSEWASIIEQPINWDEVNRKISVQRKKAFEFLKHGLESGVDVI
jgi:hypothetical protein